MQVRATRTDDPTQPSPTPPVWLADLIAIILVIAATYLPFPGETEAGSHPASLWLALGAAALLPLRHRWPLPVLVGCIGLYAAASLVGAAAAGIALATAIAMYSAAIRMRRPWTLIVGATSMLLVVAFTVGGAIGSIFDPRVVQFALVIGLGTALGDASRSRRDYIAAATERAERAEQTREAEARRRVSEERLRIARDLHDTVAHQISVISLNAGVASSVMATNPDKARAALLTVREASRTVLGEIGDLLAWLRTDDIDDDTARPQLGLAQLPALLDQFAGLGLQVTTTLDGDPATLNAAIDTTAYRAIQEGLTNAHRHGARHTANLNIRIEHDQARIVITNPTSPQPVGTPAGPYAGGWGLTGLRERVAAVRGHVTAAADPGGYRLEVTLPLTKEPHP